MHTPERWLRLEVRRADGGADEGRERAIVRELARLGNGAVEERDGALLAYRPPPEDLPDFLGDVRRRLAGAVEGPPPELRWRWVDDRDWIRAWRAGLGPRRPGTRVVVVPDGSEPEIGPEEVAVRIEPGIAFGTGEHGTTRGALRLLERTVEPGDRVLDVGSGTGVLAVAAVRLGAERAVALENDPDAVRSAAETVARNGVADRVRLAEVEATPGLVRLLAPPPFDVAAANVLARVGLPLLRPLTRAVAEDGRLILGGILEEQEEAALREARRAGWEPIAEDRDDGWWTGLLRVRVSRRRAPGR